MGAPLCVLPRLPQGRRLASTAYFFLRQSRCLPTLRSLRALRSLVPPVVLSVLSALFALSALGHKPTTDYWHKPERKQIRERAPNFPLPHTTEAATNQGASTQGVRAGRVGCAAGAQNGRSPTPFRPVFIPHKPHISPPRRQKNKKIATIPCKIKKSDYLCTRFWKAMLSEGGHKRLVP